MKLNAEQGLADTILAMQESDRLRVALFDLLAVIGDWEKHGRLPCSRSSPNYQTIRAARLVAALPSQERGK